MSEIRHQVFVSSTFDDLREERQQAIQSILELGYFPSTMETFPASDETQWQLIQRVISECDYYVVIVGGRYGSIGPTGLSYTELEYDYAVELGLPVLGFVKNNIQDLPAKFVDKDPELGALLNAFRQKVMARSCRKFTDSRELGMLVMKSLVQAIRNTPREGWIRASSARTEADISREASLRAEIDGLEEEVKSLKRKVRDMRTGELSEEPIKLPAPNEEIILRVTHREKNRPTISELRFSYIELFGVIGSSMYGYIVRKADRAGYGNRTGFSFEPALEEYVQSKHLEILGSKTISIPSHQIDALMLTFKEMGWIEYDTKKQKDGSEFRGYVLTPLGEEALVRHTTEALRS